MDGAEEDEDEEKGKEVKKKGEGKEGGRDYRKSIPRRQKLPCKTFRAVFLSPMQMYQLRPRLFYLP